eukprot:TRINITY_DN447_c0_g2_i2.p1 TRINITY_DN447_c0_g2~~TRINITY_DN447_c0_g2_i2.p1  ORF type:complete len:346 (-),score=52.72 TRINITY_DN447_c0_g2_i2:184-1221(-)
MNKEKVVVFDTVLTSDSTEFCPISGYESILLCGTYQLKEDAKKIGKAYLFDVSGPWGYSLDNNFSSVDSSAILDLKWSHQAINSKPFFASTCVDGIDVYCLEKNGLDSILGVKKTLSCEMSDSGSSLSLDWSNRLSDITPTLLCTSHSNGNVNIWELRDGGSELFSSLSWKAHSFEAWIVAFNYYSPFVVYSGADDCKFKGWDIRSGTKKEIFSKTFSMGVTTIQCCPFVEHRVVVGSYNEAVCLYDDRAFDKPLAFCETSGGVWRLKWGLNKNFIAVANMEKGFKVLQINDSETSLDIKSSYSEPHKSLGYGIDWMTPKDISSPPLLACSSFYDHLLSLWPPEL